jgi:hypothetical protein
MEIDQYSSCYALVEFTEIHEIRDKEISHKFQNLMERDILEIRYFPSLLIKLIFIIFFASLNIYLHEGCFLVNFGGTSYTRSLWHIGTLQSKTSHFQQKVIAISKSIVNYHTINP